MSDLAEPTDVSGLRVEWHDLGWLLHLLCNAKADGYGLEVVGRVRISGATGEHLIEWIDGVA